MNISEAVVFELIISVAAEVYVPLPFIKGGDVGIDVLDSHKLGFEASYNWLLPVMDNNFND